MRESLRRVGLLVGTTVRASPLRAASALLEVTGKVIGRLGIAALALLVNGAVQHDANRVILGATIIALSQPLDMGLQLIGTNARIALMEKIGFAFDHQIAQITAGIPSLEHHENPAYADELQVLRQSRGALGGALNTIINTLNTVVNTGALLIVVGALEPRLLLLTVTAVPALLATRLRYRWNKAAENASAEPGRLARHLAALATDPQAGMEFRVFGLRAEIRRRLRESHRRWRAPLVQAQQRGALLNLAESMFFAGTVTAVIGWLLYDAVHGGVSAGVLVVAAYAAGTVQESVTGSIYMFGRIGESMRSAGRLLWLKDKAAEIAGQYAGRARPPSALQSGIEFQDVSFRYPGAAQWSLQNVSFILRPGSVAALVGENGAGKSTLIKLLLGFYRPASGRILLDGTDLSDLDIEAWRAQVGAAFQDFARLEFLAGEAVGVGSLERVGDPAAATQALTDAGAADVLDALPDGLQTQLGATWKSGVDLSRGQWQKVALGRGLMRRDPLLLVFDEPTANLDAPTEHVLFERYAVAARSATERGAVTILVTHRFSTVRAADVILVLDGGRLIEMGPHEELLAEPDGHYAGLYELQARGYR